jgi:hypothetical protein
VLAGEGGAGGDEGGGGAREDDPVEQTEQLRDVGEVLAGGRLVEDVDSPLSPM